MRLTHLRRIALAAVLAIAVALLGLAQPAAADTPDLTFTVDQPVAAPGSTVNLTMTLTNNQATDVAFVYQSIQPTWATSQRSDLKYSFTSCTSEGATCTGTGTTGLGVNYALPLAPGASRTVTLTFQIAPDSGCNGSISFYSYLYYEYNGHQSAKDGIHNTPVTQVDCPPAPQPGSSNADHS
ncbi:hypothetical protein ACFYXH_21265 [Streptomyces sp. NPDC002730]|uniref:hypothetical protein n=1 Tax=Streptomyces sp. NPDC002730 TaxID=3364662 RepID=UPI0036BB79E2